VLRIFFIIIFPISIIYSQQFSLKIIVKNLEERKGNISIGLYDSENGFPKKEFGKIGVDIPITDSLVEYIFSNLQNGKYAIAIFNDENCNGKLDRSIFGWPTEDYLFSNYAEGNFGPPSFEVASFILDKDLEIILKF
jgi:uncharacterized protein (DUF2141 family)